MNELTELEMAESSSTNTVVEIKSSRFPRWFPIVLAGIGCIILVLIAKAAGFFVSIGNYSITNVTLSRSREDDQPADTKDVFRPSDTIICTVRTTGVDGIIGMRWYLGSDLIYENTGKTMNNTISTAIKSNRSAILPEGKYHVDIFMVDKPLETVYFEVKIYHPAVNPPIKVPEGHKRIEEPWYPEVPFAFDETWMIDGTEWKVNEVKVVLMDDTQDYLVAIVIDTDMDDLLSLIESEAKERTHAIALYALEKGYTERARSLLIDGKYYDLDQYIFVNLVNPVKQNAFRVKFTLSELTEPVQ